MATKKLQIIEGRLFQSATIANVTLKAADWKGSGPYTQVITLDVTSNSKIDIQADSTVLNTIITSGYTLCVKNDNGAVTVYAIGKKPSANLKIQLTITEIKKNSSGDVIWGNALR